MIAEPFAASSGEQSRGCRLSTKDAGRILNLTPLSTRILRPDTQSLAERKRLVCSPNLQPGTILWPAHFASQLQRVQHLIEWASVVLPCSNLYFFEWRAAVTAWRPGSGWRGRPGEDGRWDRWRLRWSRWPKYLKVSVRSYAPGCSRLYRGACLLQERLQEWHVPQFNQWAPVGWCTEISGATARIIPILVRSRWKESSWMTLFARGDWSTRGSRMRWMSCDGWRSPSYSVEKRWRKRLISRTEVRYSMIASKWLYASPDGGAARTSTRWAVISEGRWETTSQYLASCNVDLEHAKLRFYLSETSPRIPAPEWRTADLDVWWSRVSCCGSRRTGLRTAEKSRREVLGKHGRRSPWSKHLRIK